jgi:hypothetical protein
LVNADSKQAIAYANIGIVGANVGTVSDLNGSFNLWVDSTYNDETMLFTVIGYQALAIKIAELRKSSNITLLFKEKSYELSEVLVRPDRFKQQTLGVTTKSKMIAAGFKDNVLGYECGILMKVKKTALIKSIHINISNCSYDTIFYRLNIYKVQGKMDFENILREAIYIKMPKELVKDEIHIDLQAKNIVVDGNFLVTLEHVKDLGPGYLHFSAGLADKTYFRKTSQGNWDTASVGISISVIADVEK